MRGLAPMDRGWHDPLWWKFAIHELPPYPTRNGLQSFAMDRRLRYYPTKGMHQLPRSSTRVEYQRSCCPFGGEESPPPPERDMFRWACWVLDHCEASTCTTRFKEPRTGSSGADAIKCYKGHAEELEGQKIDSSRSLSNVARKIATVFVVGRRRSSLENVDPERRLHWIESRWLQHHAGVASIEIAWPVCARSRFLSLVTN